MFSSRTDFSWDPTITCTDPAFNPSDPRKRRVYSIEVRNDQGEVRWFETIRILANYAADSTVSSATRVRLVRDEQGVQYVLKDVWLHMDRLPEHEIRAQILADAFKYCGAADQATLKRHLLTPHVCGKVFVNDGVDTTDGMMYQELPAISSDSIFTLKLGKISNPLRQSRDPASASETHPGSLREITTSRKSQMRKSAIQTPRLPSWRGSLMKTPGQITIEELGLSPSLAPAVRTISHMAYNFSRAFTSAEASYHTVNIDDNFLRNQVYNMILPLVNEGSTYRAAVRNIRL